MVFCLLVVSVVILAISWGLLQQWQWRKCGKLPHGPMGLPIVGNVPQMIPNPYKQLSRWAIHYGKLFTLHLATKKAVVVSCPKLMKEIFSQFASTGKFKTESYTIVTRGDRGILNSSGKVWYEQRTFAVKCLKGFGFGKRSLEPIILAEALDIVEWIKREKRTTGSDSVNIGHVMQLSAVNALWTIVAGERFDLDNVAVADLMEEVMRAAFYSTKTGFIVMPWLKYIIPGLSGYNDLVVASEKLQKFIHAAFDAHLKAMIELPEYEPKDLIDCYLNKFERTTDPESTFYGKEGRQNGVSAIVELFLAGGESTSNTITHMLFYLCQHMHYQKRVQKEVDEVIGHERDPCIEDRNRMPFLEAVTLETLRYSALFPVGLIPELLDDIHCEGYTFPKGYLIIPNMYHVHHSKELWGDPEIFRPERFLGDAIAVKKAKENLVPFQPGRRSCLGEALALDIIFMFTAKMIQQFELIPDPVHTKEDYMQPEISYLLLAKRSKLIMKSRV